MAAGQASLRAAPRLIPSSLQEISAATTQTVPLFIARPADKESMTAPLVTRVAKADAAAVADAARVLAAGGLVAFPTETVYGLGADATDGRAVARLYQAKGRPAFNPLIAHVADLNAAQALARFDADATQLAAAFWPG